MGVATVPQSGLGCTPSKYGLALEGVGLVEGAYAKSLFQTWSTCMDQYRLLPAISLLYLLALTPGQGINGKDFSSQESPVGCSVTCTRIMASSCGSLGMNGLPSVYSTAISVSNIWNILQVLSSCLLLKYKIIINLIMCIYFAYGTSKCF